MARDRIEPMTLGNVRVRRAVVPRVVLELPG
jgi:hypothetical protein